MEKSEKEILGLSVAEATEVLSYVDEFYSDLWEMSKISMVTEDIFNEFEESRICYSCGISYENTGLNQGEYESHIGPESGSEYIEATCPNCGAIVISETIVYY